MASTLPKVSKTAAVYSHSKAVQILLWTRRHWDFLAILSLVLATIPPALITSHYLPSVEYANIDDSWFVDSCYKAVHGIWLGGRTVLFTYGPVMQWLFSLPVRWTGYSMGKVYSTWSTFPMWFGFLLGAFTLRLLLPEQPPWKRFVLLIGLAVFWAAPTAVQSDVRPFVSVFFFAVFLRGWYAVRFGHLRPTIFGLLGAACVAAGFLVAADVGGYTVAGFLIALAGVAIERRDVVFVRRAMSAVATALIGSLLLAVIINAITRRPFSFTFWKSSLVLVSSYRWFEAYPMDKAHKVHLIAAMAAGILIFGSRRFISRDDASLTARTGFLIAAFLYGFLGLQSGLVRSDPFHVQLSIYATVALLGAVLFGFRPGTVLSIAGVLFALTFCCFFATFNAMYVPASIRYRYFLMNHAAESCPAGWSDFDQACFPSPYAKNLEDTKAYIQQRTAVGESIFVFPWNTIYGSVTQRNIAGGLLQSYVASDEYLSHVYLRGLEIAAPRYGLYFNEGWGWPVDGVPNFTRNPEIWFWIQRHYSSDQTLPSQVVGLRDDPSRVQRVQRIVTSLQASTRLYPVVRRTSTIDVGKLDWPGAGSDLLRLRFNIHYPFWWRIRKPSHTELVITRADGSRKVVAFVVPPNQSTDVWFYPWDNEMVGYLSPNEENWHAGTRSPITHLQLRISPMDWVSVIPASVSVEGVDAVQLKLAQ
jgi:hypothetical protein